MYQIGSLQNFKVDDPEFGDFWEAVEWATELSIDDSLYGVWTSQSEGSDLLAIAYGGEVFQK